MIARLSAAFATRKVEDESKALSSDEEEGFAISSEHTAFTIGDLQMSSRPSRSTYSRVPQQDIAENGEEPTADSLESRRLRKLQRKAERKERVEYYSTKLHAILWVIAAGLTLYFTDFINVCIRSEEVGRYWFGSGVVLFGISSTLVLYMAIWVPRVKKILLEPAVYQPGLVPATAFVSVLSGLSLIIGLWPVYGLFTPGILGVLWFGGLMTAHFLPAI